MRKAEELVTTAQPALAKQWFEFFGWTGVKGGEDDLRGVGRVGG